MRPWQYGLLALIPAHPLLLDLPETLTNLSGLHPETQWTFLGLILPIIAFFVYFHVMYYKLYVKPSTTAPTPSESDEG